MSDFAAQLEHVRKRAKRERSTITGLRWRDGQLTATLEPIKKGQPMETVECDWYYGGECGCGVKHGPAHRVSRGAQQRLL